MKNKIKPEQGSYAYLHKQKLENNQHKTSILMDKDNKKGINFDDLNDWVEIKYDKTKANHIIQKEYQNNNIQSKQEVNAFNLLPRSNHNFNDNNNYYPNQNLNQPYYIANQIPEDKNMVKNIDVNTRNVETIKSTKENNEYLKIVEQKAYVQQNINSYNSMNNPNSPGISSLNTHNEINKAQIHLKNNQNPIQSIDHDVIKKNSTSNEVNEQKVYSNGYIKIQNSGIKKVNNEEYFANYPIKENDEFSINTSNFTNRYDLANYGDKMDMSNLQNNNLAFKNQNILINYTYQNPEDFPNDNEANNILDLSSRNNNNNHNKINNTNENYFSNNLKNDMKNITKKLGINCAAETNNYDNINNIKEYKTIKEDLNDSFEDNYSKENIKKQYNNNQNFDKYNVKNFNNNGDSNLYSINIEKQKNQNLEIYKNNNKNINIGQEEIISEQDSLDNDSSDFGNVVDNDMNITQQQMFDLKKEIYSINKQAKKSNADSSNKNKNIKSTNNYDITNNFNVGDKTNFSEKSKLTNLTNNNNNINNENFKNNSSKNNGSTHKPKRKPSPYLRSKEIINIEKTNSNNILSKMSESKNLVINQNELVNKPISIQTFQQNTNIMHIDPMLNSFPHMIYNMNTYNNNYSNGYGNINIGGYNPMNSPNLGIIAGQNYLNQNNPINIPNTNLPNQIGLGSNLPYSSLLPPMNYMNNVPSQIMNGSNQNNTNVNHIHNDNLNRINNMNINSSNLNNNSNSYSKISKAEISNYKPYTIKDYKEKFNKNNRNVIEELPRGLGSNVGTKEWEEKAEKNKKIKEYSKNLNNVKKINLNVFEENKIEIANKTKNKNEIEIEEPLNNYNPGNFVKSITTKNIDRKEIGKNFSNEDKESNPTQVKELLSNLNRIQEVNDVEDSFDDLENKLENELYNTKNIRPNNKQSVKKDNDNDTLDNFNLDKNKTTKVDSGKSHIHNLINLRKNSELMGNQTYNKNKISNNLNDNAIITIDMRDSKKRPKSSSKIETSNLNSKKNLNHNHNNDLNPNIQHNRDLKNKKNQVNKSSEPNKIYTTLGSDKDLYKRLKPLNTSRINSSLNTTRKSRPVSGKANKNSNVHIKNTNVAVQNKKSNNHIEDLLEKHEFYHDKIEKIKNFISKI